MAGSAPNTTEPFSTWLFLKPLEVKRWVKLASMPVMAAAARSISSGAAARVVAKTSATVNRKAVLFIRVTSATTAPTTARLPERGRRAGVSVRISNYEKPACATVCAFEILRFTPTPPPSLRMTGSGHSSPPVTLSHFDGDDRGVDNKDAVVFAPVL